MGVETNIEDPRWSASSFSDITSRVFGAAMDHLKLDKMVAEVAVLACDDTRISELNESFRGKAKPTNVLSWPSEHRGSIDDGGEPQKPDLEVEPFLGDIAMSYDTCRAEADLAGRALEAHTAHLFLHGLLHLLGYDHERAADADLMEDLERQILGKMGLPDPYS